MNLLILIGLCGVLLLIQGTSGFRYSLCHSARHETRNEHTCCNATGKMFVTQSSFRLWEHWEECAVEPEVIEDESAVNAAWRVYDCIVNKYLKGKQLTLPNFVDIIARNYPHAIKTQIVQAVHNVDEHDFAQTVYHDFDYLNSVRDAYYSIEQRICGEPLRRQKGNCDLKLEMYHRNGDCCMDVPLPFPFMYNPFRYVEDEVVDGCVNTLLTRVGTPHNNHIFSGARYMCYPACEYMMGTGLEEDLFWGEPDITALAASIIPEYFSPLLKSKILEYINLNWDTVIIQKRNLFEFPEVEMEFKHYDAHKAQRLFMSCKNVRYVESLIIDYLKMHCKREYTDFFADFGNLMVISKSAPTTSPVVTTTKKTAAKKSKG